MAYIGKQPVVGNFQVCDAISVVNGQAAYTMQVASANVEPENANHMLVSLNGVLQKPGSSFTISGATITFASNLATGDVIDFIILLGDTLNIGTPSDNGVTTASIAANAVTGAKLNTDVISAQTALTSAPASTDELLISDAGVLKRIDVSLIGGDNTPAFSAYSNSGQTLSDNTDTKVDFDTEDFDTDSAYDVSNKKFTVPSGEGGKYFFYTRIRFQKVGLSQHVLAIRVNNSEVAKRYIYSGNQTTANFAEVQYFSYDISAIQTLSAGDYVEVFAKADHTGSDGTPLNSGTIQTEFSGYKLIGV
jgi:hypothetical protein